MDSALAIGQAAAAHRLDARRNECATAGLRTPLLTGMRFQNVQNRFAYRRVASGVHETL